MRSEMGGRLWRRNRTTPPVSRQCRRPIMPLTAFACFHGEFLHV
jgi:hypothetical protein